MSEINRWSTSAGGALQNASGYFPEGQAPSTVNDAARTIMAEIKRQHQAHSGQKTATYATQGYSVTFDREVTAGERAGIWTFIADEANHSGSATLNINSLGAKDLRKPSGHMETSDIDAKQVCVVAYNTTGDYYELLSRTRKELNIVNQPVVSEATASDSIGLYVKTSGRHSQISIDNLIDQLVATGTLARIKTGTYTGDGATSQAITGVGFQPKYVKIVQRETSSQFVAIYETWDVIIDDIATGAALAHSSSATGHSTQTNAIITLGSDGFTVDDAGGDSHPNKNGTTYNYIAFG